MHGHGDSVTGLSLSSEGSYLLSNSMDNTGKGVYEYIYSFKKSLYSGHNTEFSMAFLSVFLCSAYLGCSTICTQGEMCQDFPGQCSQLWKGNLITLALFVVRGICSLTYSTTFHCWYHSGWGIKHILENDIMRELIMLQPSRILDHKFIRHQSTSRCVSDMQ